MAIVTGDRYLESLVKYVEKNAEPLIEGTLVLKLNPFGLRYVQSRLEALAEQESLLTGAPLDYLRAYVSDLGDHRALQQLGRILRFLPSLKLVSVHSPPARDPTPLCLLPFARLKVLELRGCDLSTSAARGLLELRHTLEKLICHNSTDALRHVFASRISEIKSSPRWNRLSFVSCAYNGLLLMDESLQLLPVVDTLDLSRNKFSKVDNLRKCAKLKHLDLGFNHLRTVGSFIEVSCQIVKLLLRNNALTTLHGIQNLKLLEGLDVSYNMISSISEMNYLAGLPSLQSLLLQGNPLCFAWWYRPQVFSYFPFPANLRLDEKKMSTREFWKRKIIIVSRQKQPASFGFYSPAIDDTGSDGIDNTKRKRISRLVSIKSEDESTYVCSDQDSGAGDSNHQSKKDGAHSVESNSSTIALGTAPHYREDMLHRRHNLEEEFLQLSADSISIASSDCDASFSEDDFAEFGSCIPQVDQSLIGRSAERSVDDCSSAPGLDDVHYDRGNRISSLKPNGIPVQYAGSREKTVIKIKGSCLEKKIHRRKSIKRVVSLTDEENGDFQPKTFQKPNGVGEICRDETRQVCDDESNSQIVFCR